MCKHKKHFSKNHNIYWCPQCITFHKPRKYTLHVFIGVLLISLLAFKPIHHRIVKLHKPIKDTSDIQLNDSCLLQTLTKAGSYFPEIGLRQAHKEASITLDSPIAKENHNLFGLKCYCKYSKGIKNGHSCYQSYRDCIKCYVQFTNNYWDRYCKNYAESKDYLTTLTKTK